MLVWYWNHKDFLAASRANIQEFNRVLLCEQLHNETYSKVFDS